ncbi:MAG: oligosaccharide flippase family protein [Candidatus Omnitrophica bacterium]|nr:oligosaccharide flippase family protein [Candidatus Omnitrophota bacterium]
MEKKEINSFSKKSTFAKDVLKMASAPFCTQILAIILMPIVTRLYNPDVYGIFHLFSSVVAPIAAFAGFSYSSAVVLPKKDDLASNLLFISIASTVFIALLTIPFIWFGSNLILRWLKAPELIIYLWLIPIDIFAHGMYLSLRFWNVRCKCFGRIAVSRISNALVNKGIIIIAGFSGFAISGSLIVGSIAGSLAMSFVLGEKIWKKNKLLFKDSIRWSNIIKVLKRYRKFPIYNLPMGLFSRLSPVITIFLFSFYFSKSVIGYYGLSLVVLSVPVTFIGSSIGEVFYERVARARHENRDALLVEKLFKQMVWISMLPFLILAVSGDSIFSFVFGINWQEAGVYAQILSFKMFISFIIGPVLSLVNVLEKQEIKLFLYIATTIVTFISITIGGLLNNVYIALGFFSLLNGLVTLGFGSLMIHFTGVQLSKIFAILLKCFVFCLPVVTIVVLAKLYFKVSPMFLIVISILSCVIYYSKLFRKDEFLRSTIIGVFKRTKLA